MLLILCYAMALLQALGSPLHAMDTAHNPALLSTKVASWLDFGASMWSRYQAHCVIERIASDMVSVWSSFCDLCLIVVDRLVQAMSW